MALHIVTKSSWLIWNLKAYLFNNLIELLGSFKQDTHIDGEFDKKKKKLLRLVYTLFHRPPYLLSSAFTSHDVLSTELDITIRASVCKVDRFTF